MIGNIESRIRQIVSEKGFFHFTLIDPEKTDSLQKQIVGLDATGTDGYLVGGSTGFYPTQAEETVRVIKNFSSKPVVLFPGGLFGLAKNADAIFYLTLLNSLSPYFLIGAQAQAAPLIYKMKMEAIPVGYVVFGKSSMVSIMGMTQEIEPRNYKAASAYAMAASLMGMHAVYLEGGSGVEKPLPPDTILKVRSSIPKDVLLIVGGGIREKEDARSAVESGADIIVNGTVVEESGSKSLAKIIEGCGEGVSVKRSRVLRGCP